MEKKCDTLLINKISFFFKKKDIFDIIREIEIQVKT